MKAFLKKYRKVILIAVGVVMLLTLLFAPSQNQETRGSTYNRSPNGYGAWYAYMEEQGATIQRWRKPLDQLLEQDASDAPATLLQVGQTTQWLQDRVAHGTALENWIEQGNRVVVLGVLPWQDENPATAASFESRQETPQGEMLIATSRRFDWGPVDESSASVLVGDEFGAVVMRKPRGDGDRIDAVTPYIAANAYQDEPGNFAWLAAQVGDGPIWVNEFSHGYKDREVLAQEGVKGWQDYFLRSPLVLFLIQGGVILVVAVFAQNRRWGPKQPVVPPPINNSEAYITALAGVLRRAGNSSFVLEQCRAAEQQRIQQQLGLGRRVVPLEQLLYAWEQQTGKSPEALRQLLVSDVPQRRVTEKELVDWLKRSQALRQPPYTKTES